MASLGVMACPRSPVKIVEPPGPRGVNLRDFMLLLLLPMMRMMMMMMMVIMMMMMMMTMMMMITWNPAW